MCVCVCVCVCVCARVLLYFVTVGVWNTSGLLHLKPLCPFL